MSLKKQVTTGVKWTTLATVVLAVVALLKISVLARFLEKSDFGLMALVTFVMGFMNLFNDMGLTSAILHKQDVTKRQYASLYWFNLLFSGVIYMVLLGVTPFVSAFYKEQELNVLIPLVGLNLLISGIGTMFKTIERKHLLFKQIALIDIGCAAVSLLLAIYLAVNNYGVYALVYPLILQVLLNNILYLGLGLKKYGLQLHFKVAETKPFLKIGIYQVGGQVVNYFNRDLDILIIGKFFSSEILGSYSLARELVRRPISFINPIFSKIGAPTLARYVNNPLKLKEYFLKMTNILASLVIPMYFLIALLAYPIIWVLYGENYTEITLIVQILSINMILRIIGGNVGNLVIATGRTDLDFKWNIFTFIVTPLFVIIGGFFNITMVAVMITLSAIILYVPGYHFLIKKMIDVSFKEYSMAILKINLRQFLKFK